MRHARRDYDRIQDPARLIPDDEPVFLIRAKDEVSGAAVRAWADLHDANGGDPAMSAAARAHAALMDAWAPKQKADAPAGALGAGKLTHVCGLSGYCPLPVQPFRRV